MKRWILISVGTLLALVLLRIVLEPSDHPLPFRGFGAGDLERVQAGLTTSLMTQDDVITLSGSKRVILVGENHFLVEPQRYVTALLDSIRSSSLVLLLELSKDSQHDIDLYMESGDESRLRPVWENKRNLPLHHLVHWAYQNRKQVKKVVAFDENFWQVGLNRLFLSDTRNQTMCDALVEAYRKFPDARIVAYGGQMHMTLSGRYRFDSESRSPAGARILRAGIPRTEVLSVMLGGQGYFPADTVWKTPGAASMKGPVGDLPYEFFINYPVFGSARAGELFDVFVNLGPVTTIER